MKIMAEVSFEIEADDLLALKQLADKQGLSVGDAARTAMMKECHRLLRDHYDIEIKKEEETESPATIA